MTEKQQTAVQWLIEQIKIDQTKQVYSLAEWEVTFKIALEMEREQIIDAVSKGFDNCEEGKVRWLGEHYYNETYQNKSRE